MCNAVGIVFWFFCLFGFFWDPQIRCSRLPSSLFLLYSPRIQATSGHCQGEENWGFLWKFPLNLSVKLQESGGSGLRPQDSLRFLWILRICWTTMAIWIEALYFCAAYMLSSGFLSAGRASGDSSPCNLFQDPGWESLTGANADSCCIW